MKRIISRFIHLSGCLLCIIASCFTVSAQTRQTNQPITSRIHQSTHYQMKDHLIRMESETFVVHLNPATLETTFLRKDHVNDRVSISQAVFHKKKFDINLDDQSILYPQDDFRITFHLDEKMLKMIFSSLKPQTIPWPSVLMKKEPTFLIWPHFEGNYIPLDDTIWIDYLKSRKWNTT